MLLVDNDSDEPVRPWRCTLSPVSSGSFLSFVKSNYWVHQGQSHIRGVFGIFISCWSNMAAQSVGTPSQNSFGTKLFLMLQPLPQSSGWRRWWTLLFRLLPFEQSDTASVWHCSRRSDRSVPDIAVFDRWLGIQIEPWDDPQSFALMPR